MAKQWRTPFTLIYIVVLCSLVICNDVCFANGFRTLVATYFRAHDLSSSSCPIEVSLKFEREISLENISAGPNVTPEATSSGNCTNSLTTPVSLRHSSSVLLSETADGECSSQKSSKESHLPIATFDEWTKEKLKQDHRKPPSSASEKGQPSSGSQQLAPSTAATRNYASKECGAKVLLSNSEAENTKAILNEKEKDEYMRNPCEKAEYKFVIIELCETIQLRSIELANYELFSSGPRTIRLWSAERFPAGEWQLISELTAIDSRQIQQFPISSNGIYVKFLKVELLSHYGNEHYCTLSVLKILGISMIDEYEAEAEAASVAHTRNNPVTGTETKPNNTVIETVVTTAATPLSPVQENGVSKEYVEASGINEEDLESNPTLIDMVDKASGRLISKLVGVMKENFRGRRSDCNDTRKCEVANPFVECYICPKDGYHIYPIQFCRAFIWKISLHSRKRREEKRISLSLPAAPRELWSQSRSRRCRLAFLRKRFLRFCRASVKTDQQLSESGDMKAHDSSSAKAASDEQQQINQRAVHAIPSEVWPASSTSHKESVFMKLNKRIAALELNMSLSSEYLSELSRQYVAQTDEHHKRMKQAKEIVDEAVDAIYARVNETLAEKIALLRKEVDTLSYWLSSMRSTASKMTLGQLTRGAEKRSNEKCNTQPTQLHRYSPPDDDLWTSEQVVYMVVSIQLVTVLLLALLSFCYQRLVTDRHLSDNQRAEVEDLVNNKLSNVFQKNRSSLYVAQQHCHTTQQCSNTTGPMFKSYVVQQHDSIKQRCPSTEGVCSLHSDDGDNFIAQCTSSSSTQISDDESGSEEVHMTTDHSFSPSELQRLTSMVSAALHQ